MLNDKLAWMIAGVLLTSPLAVAGAQYPQRPVPVRPQPQRWVALGQANVDGQQDHDTISIGRAAGVYRSIQLRVQHAPIRFDHVVVRYGNGQSEQLQLRSVIHAGGATRAIPLTGGGRIVQNVELWYGRANPASRRPQVLLFGMP